MTQVTRQRIEAGFTCAHPPEVPKFSRKITYIHGLLPSQAVIPPYRTYMKECTVLGVGRYISQLANGTGTFRRHLAKKNSRTLDHVLAAKSVYLSLAHVAW